jgi:hypothetical protein
MKSRTWHVHRSRDHRNCLKMEDGGSLYPFENMADEMIPVAGYGLLLLPELVEHAELRGAPVQTAAILYSVCY